MRRVAVLLVLLGGMLGLKLLKAEPVTVGDPLTLAAIGFVVLAAFTIAEVGQRLGLPRVTGYIVTGIVLGPYATNILSQTVVEEMRMFNTLALGLIATTAGLELDIAAMRRVWRTLIATTGIKLVLVFPTVGLVFYALESNFGFLGIAGPAVLAMTLLIGTFALGTSPSVTLAVLSETRAKGRLSDLVLGAAVLKDLVVVIVLAITIAIANSLLDPAAVLGPSVLVHVAEEIGYTVVAGAAVGALLILYIRFVHAEMLLFVSAMILVVAEVSQALHLELLLVFIVAGFVVRNFSRFEHELHHPLTLVSLPVFVVFFTIAGASVSLTTLYALLPLALALSAVRAAGFWVAARAGGAIGRESALIQRTAWLGYLPLAGVTLGLIGLASARVTPLSAEITGLGMAFVAINLLVGPITLRAALGRAGDIPQKATPSAPPAAPRPSLPPEIAHYDVASELELAHAQLSDAKLTAALDRAVQEVSDTLFGFRRMTLDPWAATARNAAMAAIVEGEHKLETLRGFAETADTAEIRARAAALEALFDALQRRLRALPALAEVPLLPADRRVQRGDRFAVRWRKRGSRLLHIVSFGRAHRRRVVPVRMSARTAFEPQLARLCLDALADWSRAHAALYEELRRWGTGSQSAEETRAAIETHLADWRERFEADVRRALSLGLRQFASLAARAGGPALPGNRVRYSNVEQQVRGSLDALPNSASGWAAGLEAAQQTLLLWVQMAAIDEALDTALRDDILRPLTEACDVSLPKVELVRDRVADVATRLPKKDDPDARETNEKLLLACRNAFPTAAQAELRRARARFARSAAERDLAFELRALVDTLPAKLTVLRAGSSVHLAATPKDFATRSIALRQLADQKLIGELLPIVDGVIGDVSLRIATVSVQIRDAVDIASNALEPGPAGADALDPALAAQGIERAVERLSHIHEGLIEAAERTREELGKRVDSIHAELHALAFGQPSAELGLARVEPLLGGLKRALSAQASPRLARLQQGYRDLRAQLRRLYGSELSRELQLRYARATLDARSIRAYLQEWRASAELPPTYARLFTLEPLRDRRFFVANRAELDGLLAAERAWTDGGPSSALVVGRHGSGMTSMLNLLQVEVATRRVLRPDWSLSERALGILPTLADDLGCEHDFEAVRAAIAAQRTVVLLDELQSWFTPDAAGLRQLERFLELVVATHRDVFWIITAEQDALSVLEEALTIREAFGQVVRLSPATADGLAEVLEARHRVSGFDIVYPRTLASRFLRHFRSRSEREVFFRLLGRMTEGNLRLAIVAWRRTVDRPEGSRIEPSLHRLLGMGLPFVTLLPPRPTSMLVQLLRFGPLDPESLGRGSGLGAGEAVRNAAFLQSAGLVEPVASGREELRIPPEIQEAVVRGLRDLGAGRTGGLR